MDFLKDLWGFLKDRKKFWLLPLILIMLMFGALMVFAGGSEELSWTMSNLFAAMQVRTLLPGQLYAALVQATGYRAGPGSSSFFEGSAQARFIELFTNHDEKPSEAETTILQALALMNGRIMAEMTNLETCDTLAAVAEAPYLDTVGRIEALYLAALTRRPRPDELKRLSPYVESGGHSGNRSQALADVFWALLNSPEFRFNH